MHARMVRMPRHSCSSVPLPPRRLKYVEMLGARPLLPRAARAKASSHGHSSAWRGADAQLYCSSSYGRYQPRKLRRADQGAVRM